MARNSPDISLGQTYCSIRCFVLRRDSGNGGVVLTVCVYLQAMEKCVDEGLVKNVGLSNFNSIQVQNVIDNCRIKPSVLQVRSTMTAYVLPNRRKQLLNFTDMLSNTCLF